MVLTGFLLPDWIGRQWRRWLSLVPGALVAGGFYLWLINTSTRKAVERYLAGRKDGGGGH